MGYCVKKNIFTVALVNARSLKNKLTSFKCTIDEIGTDVCVVTESWFQKTDKSINSILEDFKHKTGYDFLRKDRDTGRRGGGIAICFNTSRIQLAKAKIPPSKHEVYASIGRRMGQRRKIAILAIYIPPWYNAEQNRSLFKYTNDAIMALKAKYEDPYIVVAGDFNRRDFSLATAEHPDIKPVTTSPTRGQAILDIIGSNINHTITDNGTLESIKSDEGVHTDHLTVFCQFRMPRVPSYSIQTYTYDHLTEDGHQMFGEWLRNEADWSLLLKADDVNSAVSELHSKYAEAVAECYQRKTRKKKSSEPYWMTDWLRKDIAARRKVFKTDKKRTVRWKLLKRRISRQVKKRKKKHNDFVIGKFERETNPGKFFHHLQCLMGNEVKERWSPTQMYPNDSEAEVAEKLASFFNDISSQYQPLDQTKILPTFERQLPLISEGDVKKRMKESKKLTSRVPGDIPSTLYGLYPNELAQPIAHVFNMITRTCQWPDAWKVEYVTVIPKGPDPQEPSECRNIACTNYLSKMYESFVLEWSREEVLPKPNQYGGEKGASSTQLLIEVISDITETLEDNRAASVLSAIDFSKAFNRLDHEKCLRTFSNKGASTQVLALLAAFLSGRRMTVRVGTECSQLRSVNAGAPQGSVLGCYLFNIGVDDLEDGQGTPPPAQEEAHQETLGRTDDFPAASTPVRVRQNEELTESPIARQNLSASRQAFDLLPRVANVPPWLRKPKDPRFIDTPLKSYKYVDDNVNTSQVNMKKARLLTEGDVTFKEIVDLRTQGHLEHVAMNAERKGMAINAGKTGLMIVSAATSFQAKTQLKMGDKTIQGSNTLRILGVTLSNDLSFQPHIEKISNKMRSKTWALAKLRKKGLSEEKLLKAYKCLIRPSVEYAAVAWHSMITAGQADLLERQQTQALKNIYGPTLSAAKLRRKAGIETLSNRREQLVMNFAKKSVNNPRCRGWYEERKRPVYARRSNTVYPKYKEDVARTDRHRNNPKNYLRRKLNENQ